METAITMDMSKHYQIKLSQLWAKYAIAQARNDQLGMRYLQLQIAKLRYEQPVIIPGRIK